jgi:putative tricarboxylic transport membrane protein
MPRDLVSALFWLAVAIFAAVEGLALKLGTLSRPGPGFFPFWGGVVLGLLSLVHLVRSLGTYSVRARSAVRPAKLALVVAATLGYLLLLELLGFVAVTCLFLFLLFRLEERSWTFSAVGALLGALASYGLFQVWLKTQLPTGPFGF